MIEALGILSIIFILGIGYFLDQRNIDKYYEEKFKLHRLYCEALTRSNLDYVLKMETRLTKAISKIVQKDSSQ